MAARNIDISPNGKLLLLADNVSGVVSVYNLPACTLLRVITPTLDMSDSLAIHGYPWMPGYKFVTIEERPSFYSNRSAMAYFSNARFMDDSTILLSGPLYAFVLSQASSSEVPTEVRVSESSIMIYDLRHSHFTHVIPLETKGDIWPQTEVLAYDSKTHQAIVDMCANFEMRRNHYDSAWALAAYDLNGKFTRWLAKEPLEMREYSLGASNFLAMCPRVAVKPDGNYIYGFKMVPRIEDRESGGALSLVVPSDNLQYFRNFRQTLLTQGFVRSSQFDSLFHWKPYWLSNLAVREDGTIVAMSTIRTSERPFESEKLIQWYQPSGALEAETIIPYDSSRGNIQLAQYLPSQNQIAILTSDRNGWTMTRYAPKAISTGN
ncbi:MAG TPA: hypothetical protein VFH95_10605 [Candidatus Kapabacteria bacterium]|nr:hypothetical protein [Candidatus Kapabacteria bacterium]